MLNTIIVIGFCVSIIGQDTGGREPHRGDLMIDKPKPKPDPKQIPTTFPRMNIIDPTCYSYSDMPSLYPEIYSNPPEIQIIQLPAFKPQFTTMRPTTESGFESTFEPTAYSIQRSKPTSYPSLVPKTSLQPYSASLTFFPTEFISPQLPACTLSILPTCLNTLSPSLNLVPIAPLFPYPEPAPTTIPSTSKPSSSYPQYQSNNPITTAPTLNLATSSPSSVHSLPYDCIPVISPQMQPMISNSNIPSTLPVESVQVPSSTSFTPTPSIDSTRPLHYPSTAPSKDYLSSFPQTAPFPCQNQQTSYAPSDPYDDCMPFQNPLEQPSSEPLNSNAPSSSDYTNWPSLDLYLPLSLHSSLPSYSSPVMTLYPIIISSCPKSNYPSSNSDPDLYSNIPTMLPVIITHPSISPVVQPLNSISLLPSTFQYLSSTPLSDYPNLINSPDTILPSIYQPVASVSTYPSFVNYPLTSPTLQPSNDFILIPSTSSLTQSPIPSTQAPSDHSNSPVSGHDYPSANPSLLTRLPRSTTKHPTLMPSQLLTHDPHYIPSTSPINYPEILNFNVLAGNLTMHSRRFLVEYPNQPSLSPECKFVLGKVIGETILGSSTESIINILIDDNSSTLHQNVLSSFHHLIIQLNISYVLESTTLNISSEADIIYALNQSIVQFTLQKYVRANSNSLCNEFSWAVFCLSSDIEGCLLSIIDFHQYSVSSYYCYESHDQNWNGLYFWPKYFTGYSIWLLALLVLWGCSLCSSLSRLYAIASDTMTAHSSITKLSKQLSTIKAFLSLTAIAACLCRVVYFLLLFSDTALQGFTNFACVEFSNTIMKQKSLNEGTFWSPYYILAATLFYPICAVQGVLRVKFFFAFNDSIGIVVSHNNTALNVLAIVIRRIVVAFSIAAIFVEIFLVGISRRTGSRSEVLVFGGSVQLICGVLTALAALIHLVNISSNQCSSSVNEERFKAVERQQKASSDDNSIFSITSLMKAKYELSKRYKKGTKELPMSSGLIVKTRGLRRAQSGSNEFNTVSPNEPFGIDISDISVSDSSEYHSLKPKINQRVVNVLKEDEVPNIERQVAIANDASVKGTVVSDRLTMLVWLIVGLLSIFAGTSIVIKSPLGAFIVSSIALRAMEIVFVLMSLTDVRVRRDRWRLLSRRVIESVDLASPSQGDDIKLQSAAEKRDTKQSIQRYRKGSRLAAAAIVKS